jgi:dihydrofolate reductase
VFWDYAEIWRAAEKVVYSRTLERAPSGRTRIEREFDPEQLRKLKQDARADLTIGGAELAGQALAAGLIDECHLILHPVLVGGGKRALPLGVRAQLELLAQRRFAGGAAYLAYRLAP